MILTVENLHYQRHGQALLSAVNLQMAAGQVTSVLGPNGAGKSTLIKLLTGEWSARLGQINLLQKPLNKWSLKARARHLACLPQMSQLNFPFSVEDVVRMGRVPFATNQITNRAIARDAMALMDITYLTQRLYTELSGGEKQRVQLARVMAQVWPDTSTCERLLILDEPSGALDLGHKQQLLAALKFLTGRGIAVLLVEHDLNMALHCADQILALECGQVKAQGNAPEVVSAALLEDLFKAKVCLQTKPDGSGVNVCY